MKYQTHRNMEEDHRAVDNMSGPIEDKTVQGNRGIEAIERGILSYKCKILALSKVK